MTADDRLNSHPRYVRADMQSRAVFPLTRDIDDRSRTQLLRLHLEDQHVVKLAFAAVLNDGGTK